MSSQNDCGVQNLLEERSSAPSAGAGREVSRWKKETNRVLLGLLLSAVSLFGGTIAFALPGLLLTFLGFRSLRTENEDFRRAGNLTFTRLCLAVAGTVIDATIFRSYPFFLWGKGVVFFLDGCLLLLALFYVWRGIAAVRKECQLSTDLKEVTGMLIAGGVFLGLTFFYGRFPAVLFLLFLLGFVILKSYRLSQEVDKTGYKMEERTFRLSDRRIVSAVLLMTVCGVLFGLLFFQKYPMGWRMLETVSDAETDRIREELVTLGFPRELLSDLQEEDILACEGAKRVVVSSRNHPMNDGREVIEKTDRGESHHRIYDKEELKITGIAVELPDERASWRIFHHFLWEENPGFVGTEAIRIRKRHSDPSWSLRGEVEGRVLYEKAENTFVSEQLFMEKGNVYLMDSDRSDTCATFSFPKEGERQRGYVTYLIADNGMPGAIIDCPIVYVHQESRIQFPVMVAEERTRRNGRLFWDVFQKRWDSVQFYPKDITER